MKTRYMGWFLFGAVATLGFLPRESQAAAVGSYVALKAGVYSPSSTFNFDNVDIETTFDGDTRTGVDAEFAFGHYVLPSLALELGVGYFKGEGTFEPEVASASHRQVDFDVIPLLLTGKAFIPVGHVNPYGELGIGAYFTSFKVEDNLNSFSGNTTFGIHAGAGVNVDVTQQVFVGVEGRYLTANPSFGNQKIKLNDSEYSLRGFDLNGFTTTLAVGYGF